MKFIVIAIIAVAALVGIALFNRQPDTAVLSFTSVNQSLERGAVLYDVRTPEEYTEGHFKNAIPHPLQDIEAGTLPSVSKDTTIYVYCRSGNRSSQAKTLLTAAGYTNVVDLGGLTDVQSIGGEIIKE